MPKLARLVILAGALACSPPGGRGEQTCTAPVTQAPSDAGVEALIITNDALAPAFAAYAALHSVTGPRTEVLTVSQICAAGTCVDADPKNDTVKAIKDAIRARAGLRYVVLGGGADAVPARQVHDEYTNALVPTYSYRADFLTDYYYSDFSEWDTDHDGVYARKGVDTPGYLPSVAVSRVPVHSGAQAFDYFTKLVKHLTAYDPQTVRKALSLSNIATTVQGVNIDAATYLEAPGRTNSLLPAGFAVKKLYATRTVDPGAGVSSLANQLAALAEGQNLVVHSGHGGPDQVTVEIDGSATLTGAAAYALTNGTRPIFLSSGCEAGDFSVAGHAGERLVLAPAGGAIAYLGNVPVGLGLAGGMQMIDELLRSASAHEPVLLADAYLAAHQHLPKTDTFSTTVLGFPVSAQVIDQHSYAWTQKSVVLLGDALIPVWKTPLPPAPRLSATRVEDCGASVITFTLSESASGTLRFLADGELYVVPVSGTTVSATVPGLPAFVMVGFTSATTLPGFAELTF